MHIEISKRLAELMNGTMWVESGGPGCGSTFFFTAFENGALVIRFSDMVNMDQIGQDIQYTLARLNLAPKPEPAVPNVPASAKGLAFYARKDISRSWAEIQGYLARLSAVFGGQVNMNATDWTAWMTKVNASLAQNNSQLEAYDRPGGVAVAGLKSLAAFCESYAENHASFVAEVNGLWKDKSIAWSVGAPFQDGTRRVRYSFASGRLDMIFDSTYPLLNTQFVGDFLYDRQDTIPSRPPQVKAGGPRNPKWCRQCGGEGHFCEKCEKYSGKCCPWCSTNRDKRPTCPGCKGQGVV